MPKMSTGLGEDTTIEWKMIDDKATIKVLLPATAAIMTTRRITTEPEVENDIRGRARGRLGSNESTFHDLHCGGEADHTRDLGHLLLESGNDRVQAIEYCHAIARMTKTQIEVKQ